MGSGDLVKLAGIKAETIRYYENEVKLITKQGDLMIRFYEKGKWHRYVELLIPVKNLV